MPKLTRRSLRTGPADGQTIVEFAMVMLILIPFLVLLAAMLLSLYQASAVNQGASWLGQRITNSGTACTDSPTTTTCDWYAEFKDQMAGLGVVVSPADTVAISITGPDGTVRYFDQTQPTLVPTTAYGDTVMVRFVKPLTGGLFAGSGFQDIIENMPGSSDTWVGVAQLEKSPGSSSIPVVADFGLNYTSTVTSDVPSAYWRLESGGTVLNETSEDSAKIGTIGPSVGTGFPSLIAAGSDSAFNFDGSSGSWLSVPDSTALDTGPGGAFSVEFWLAFGSNCAASEEPILVRGSSAIVMSPAAGCAGNTLSVNLGSNLQISATPAILRDSPHHIVVTYDGTHQAGGYVEVHIFIDGHNAPLRGGPSDNRFPVSAVSGWTGFSGELFWAAQDSSNGSARFIGSLDELALYARPLTGDLVTLHYAAGTKNGNVTVDEGRAIYFQDLSNGLPSSWQWDFAGGSGPITAENPAVTWTTGGSKTVSLTVGNNSASISVVVQPVLVSPDFSFTYAASSETFVNQTSGTPLYVFWDFGDGSGSTEASPPPHRYGAGTYTVSLTVETADGAWGVIQHQVTIPF